MTAAAERSADLMSAFPADLLDPATPPRWSAERDTYELFSYEDVRRLTADRDRVFTQAYGDPAEHPLSGFVWATDPPEHDRLRRPISEPFRPRGVQRLLPVIQEAIRDLLGTCARDGVFDLALFSRRLPNRIICGLLDVDATVEEPAVDRLLRAHAESATTATPPNGQQWRDWAARLLAAKRSQPGTGLIDHLLQVQADGYPLTDAEIESDIAGMASAGTDTTAAQIAATVLWLDGLGELNAAARDQQLRVTAVEEILRWDPAFPAVRIQAVEPVRFGGLEIPPGAPVTGWISSANRDADVFGPTAGSIDLRRSPNPHQTFVLGRHSCLGAPLARAELHAVVGMLPALLPGLRSDPSDPPSRLLGIVHNVTEARLIYDADRSSAAGGAGPAGGTSR